MSSPPSTEPTSAQSPTHSETLAPWRTPLSRAIHRNRSVPFSRYLQLATLKPDGTPANRTVVFRGFFAQTNQLMFISDHRSQKTQEIIHNPNTEVCWYFTKTREQFRLSGQITLITANTQPATLLNARQQIWQNISAKAKLQFAWPCPKAKRTDDDAAFNPPPPDNQTPPPSFCLLLLTVHNVDHLALQGEPQNRHLYSKVKNASKVERPLEVSWTNQTNEQRWHITTVNP